MAKKHVDREKTLTYGELKVLDYINSLATVKNQDLSENIMGDGYDWCVARPKTIAKMLNMDENAARRYYRILIEKRLVVKKKILWQMANGEEAWINGYRPDNDVAAAYAKEVSGYVEPNPNKPKYIKSLMLYTALLRPV